MAKPKTKYKFNLPNNIDEITLDTYISILRLHNEKQDKFDRLDVLSVLSKIPREELERYDADVVAYVLTKLSFLDEHIDDTPTNEIVINNERYFINSEEKLKTKEFIDSQIILESDNYNYPTLLAILCRKENEKYDDDFIANELNDRIKMFSKQPISKIMKLISFFLIQWIQSPTIFNLYSKAMVEEGNLILRNIESLEKHGYGLKLFMNSQMKTLQSLQQSLNNISLQL